VLLVAALGVHVGVFTTSGVDARAMCFAT